MKTLECGNCKRVQATGKFCVECGSTLIEKVTIGVKFKPMRTDQSPENIRKSIRSLLYRIGVKDKDITIREENHIASVDYELLGTKYNFRSFRQINSKLNLSAIEQLIRGRVLGIERGIETAQQAFSGYTALPAPKTYDDMTEAELKALLKKHHPDTGDGNLTELGKIKSALDRK
jgi:hypothetical protein